jgi:peroxiredoxin
MARRADVPEIEQALRNARTQSGVSLMALAEATPVLLMFLRHAGCPFCREALADLARSRADIERAGARVVLVHMRDSRHIERLVARYGLQEVERICDAERQLYRAFGLERGTLRQVLGLRAMVRGVDAAIVRRHGMGRPSADPFQMPGIFLLAEGRVVGRFRHKSAADRPDFLALCKKL